MTAIFDTVIRGGTIIDGTRFPRYIGDVGISHGVVAKIGRIAKGAGRYEIDAHGLIVAPGFIDLHTHYDAQVHWDPYCTGASWHGFTTVMTGNCGFGFAPCRPEHRDRAMLMMENTEQVPIAAMRTAMSWDWVTFPEWMDHLRSVPKGVNMMMYMPVNPLLIYVMGIEAAKTREATEAERVEMRQLLHEAMDAGACGFAFSQLGKANLHLDYDGTPMPSDIMAFAEVENLARVLQERDEGIIQVLCEIPGAEKEARWKTERLAEISGRPVLYNAVLPVDAMPDHHRNGLRWLEAANAKGHRIYGQGATGRFWSEFTMRENNLWGAVPSLHTFQIAPPEEKLRLARDPEFRAAVRADNANVELMYTGLGPINTVVFKSARGHSRWSGFEQRRIEEIAADLSSDVIDTFFEIIADTNLDGDFRTPSVSSENPELQKEVLGHDLVIPGTSDGGAHVKFFCGNGYSTDIIAWLIREHKLFTLEDFHFRMSSMPAKVVGLTDRGTLEVGKAADIVVYDYEAVDHDVFNFALAEDLPNGDWRRVDHARGYRHVLVNGEEILNDGVTSGRTPGRVLRITEERAPVFAMAAE